MAAIPISITADPSGGNAIVEVLRRVVTAGQQSAKAFQELRDAGLGAAQAHKAMADALNGTSKYLADADAKAKAASISMADLQKQMDATGQTATQAAKALGATGDAANSLVGKFRQAQQATQDFETATGKAEAASRRFWNHMAVAGAAGIVGLNVATSQLESIGQEASNTQKKLEAMLRVRGESGGAGAIESAVGGLVKATGEGDLKFRDASAHLLSFGLTAQQVAQILPGLSGQAVTMGQSIDTVSDSFGRAFASGNIGALTRTGVVLSEADKAAIGMAYNVSEAAGKQELFNRVLASYANFAVHAGDATDDATKKIAYFGYQTQLAERDIGNGAREMKASWMASLTPMVGSLHEHHSGLLKSIGGVMELGRDISNIGAPIFGAVKLYKEWKVAQDLATIASKLNTTSNIANAISVAADGDAAAAASVKFGLLARAKALAMTPLGAVGIGLAAGAGIYEAARATGALDPDEHPDTLTALSNAGGRTWSFLTGQGFYGYDEWAKGDAEEQYSLAITERSKQRRAAKAAGASPASLTGIGAAYAPDSAPFGLAGAGAAFGSFDGAGDAGGASISAGGGSGGGSGGITQAAIWALQDRIRNTPDKHEKFRLRNQLVEMQRAYAAQKSTTRQEGRDARTNSVADVGALRDDAMERVAQLRDNAELAGFQDKTAMVMQLRGLHGRGNEDQREALRAAFEARDKARKADLDEQVGQIQAQADLVAAQAKASGMIGVAAQATLRRGLADYNRALAVAHARANMERAEAADLMQTASPSVGDLESASGLGAALHAGFSLYDVSRSIELQHALERARERGEQGGIGSNGSSGLYARAVAASAPLANLAKASVLGGNAAAYAPIYDESVGNSGQRHRVPLQGREKRLPGGSTVIEVYGQIEINNPLARHVASYGR